VVKRGHVVVLVLPIELMTYVYEEVGNLDH